MKHRRSSEDSAALEPSTKKTAIGEKVICCFGMVIDLPLELAHGGDLQETPVPLRVLEDDFRVWALNSDTVFGHLDLNTRKIIRVLGKDLRLQLFAERTPLRDTSGAGRKLRHKHNTTEYLASLKLFVVLYGPPCLFEAVGLFASKCNLFLQHPRYCDYNVPYRNPHCLTSESLNDIYTFELKDFFDLDMMAPPTAFCNPIDLFTNSTEQESLVECQSPCALRTELYKHQKQALTFMLRREKGWALNGSLQDIWKKEDDSSGRLVYVNIISGQKQIKPPSDFRGGLLTDAPGLGKSLSIIALIASTRESRGTVFSDEASLHTTLLVVPKTLIQMWKDELRRHLKGPDAIRTGVYYGKDRNKLLTELTSYDLIITTYSVVRLDWKTSLSQSSDSFTLHGAKWGRIVLDEAHIIREPSKSFARSICALQAECRWGLTGTPIQNRLTDLYSLFKFLRCSPFDDSKVFNAQVTQAWITRSDPNAVAKLKTLVNCLSLRRPKATIELPPRSDETFHLDFNNQERDYYQRVRASTLRHINAVDHGIDGASFLNTLHLVNELRLICNHGIINRKAIDKEVESTNAMPFWNEQDGQLYFDQLEQAGLAFCSNPECRQDLTSALSSETDTRHLEEPRIVESQLLELFCSSCFYDLIGRFQRVFKVCNHLPRCSSDNIEQFNQENKSSGLDWGVDTPSKIQRLLVDLSATPDNVKSVIFSGWTKTFDIIQPRLMAKSIRCVRLDGTSSASSRANVVRVFREDPGVKVLLATITCGGIGLDLTVASRAYIMEPQWNPMSELQALDRIHRLGQQKEVKTIRYVMKGSWEEQVLKLQRRKQELADLTLSGGAISRAELTHGRLQYLKELVG